MNKLKKQLKSAYTLVELIMVLAIVGVLLTAGLGSYYFLRDSITVTNNVQSLKGALRDAQDKALTFSVYNNNNNDYKTDPAAPRYWVYAYSLEYDATNSQYALYSIRDDSGNTLTSPTFDSSQLQTNSQSLQSSGGWGSNPSRFCSNGGSNQINGVGFANACTLEATYPVDSTVVLGSTSCNVLFTTVSSKIKISKSSDPTSLGYCRIQIQRTLKSQTLCFYNTGIGDIKITDGLQPNCP